MPVTVVVGGQYGSEGKGKTVAYLAHRDHVAAVVRCGGPNAGHSFRYRGTKYALRQVPCGVINPSTILFLAPGSAVNPTILLQEIEKYKVEKGRIRVDPFAAIITESEIQLERRLKLRDRISSTLSGTGAATARRVLRHPALRLARDIPELQDYLSDVSTELNTLLSHGQRVIIEGTQGFGLSLYHSRQYPYTTSRDTSASSVLAEAGISPLHVDQVLLVIRTFPIRVAGRSGPLPHECSWEHVTKMSGYPFPLSEYGVVSGSLRRVAEFDIALVRRATTINRPTGLVLTGVDYLDYKNLAKTSAEQLTAATRNFLSHLAGELSTKLSLIGTGPDLDHMIDCR